MSKANREVINAWRKILREKKCFGCGGRFAYWETIHHTNGGMYCDICNDELEKGKEHHENQRRHNTDKGRPGQTER